MQDEPKEGLQTDEETLSSAEILERAKKENEKFGDERQRGRMQLGNYAGFMAVEFACAVIMIVSLIVYRDVPPELYCILFTGCAAQNIVQACVNQNKKTKMFFTVCAVLIAVGTAIMWVLWILKLCGVAL